MWLADKYETRKDGEIMRTKKTARNSGNYSTPKTSTHRDDASISNSEYERGTRIAGWMFCAMFAFMAIWVVVCGW